MCLEGNLLEHFSVVYFLLANVSINKKVVTESLQVLNRRVSYYINRLQTSKLWRSDLVWELPLTLWNHQEHSWIPKNTSIQVLCFPDSYYQFLDFLGQLISSFFYLFYFLGQSRLDFPVRIFLPKSIWRGINRFTEQEERKEARPSGTDGIIPVSYFELNKQKWCSVKGQSPHIQGLRI